MSIGFARCRTVFLAAAVVVGGAACAFHEPLPEIQKPLGYDTVDVPLAGCVTSLPPVRADIECGATEIGKRIDPKAVCYLLEALRTWVTSGPADAKSVRPDDWNHVRAVCVRRLFQTHAVDLPAHMTPIPPFSRSLLQLESDAPNRSHRMFVQMLEESRTLRYFVLPRDVPVLR